MGFGWSSRTSCGDWGNRLEAGQRSRQAPSCQVNCRSSSPQPSDTGVLASYGEVAAIPGQIKDNASQTHDTPNPPQPQLVADAIARLVEATERRPLRTVVMPEGLDYGVERLNEAVAPIQNDLLRSMGMSSLI